MVSQNRWDMPRTVELPFDFGSDVIVDGDEKLVFKVIAIQLYPSGNQWSLSWFCDGSHRTDWFDEFRLSEAP